MSTVDTHLTGFITGRLAVQADAGFAIDVYPPRQEDAVSAGRVVRREDSGGDHGDGRIGTLFPHWNRHCDATIRRRRLAVRVVVSLHVDEGDVEVRALV